MPSSACIASLVSYKKHYQRIGVSAHVSTSLSGLDTLGTFLFDKRKSRQRVTLLLVPCSWFEYTHKTSAASGGKGEVVSLDVGVLAKWEVQLDPWDALSL